MEKQDYFTNKLLIAMPSMVDINFNRSVVYIEEHNQDGAIGIIINKTMDLTVANLLAHLDIPIKNSDEATQQVFIGGPVSQEQGFVLHENKLTSDPNHPLNISTSKEVLTQIGQGTGPVEYIITLGYAGWEPGQLEKEIIANDWLVAPYNPDIILRTPASNRWEQAAKLIGININHLSGQTGHA